MKMLLENNSLTVCLEGRVDSNNAASVEEKLRLKGRETRA